MPSDRLKIRDDAIEPQRIEHRVAQRQPVGIEAQRAAVLDAEHHGRRFGVRRDEPAHVEVPPLSADEPERVPFNRRKDAVHRQQNRDRNCGEANPRSLCDRDQHHRCRQHHDGPHRQQIA